MLSSTPSVEPSMPVANPARPLSRRGKQLATLKARRVGLACSTPARLQTGAAPPDVRDVTAKQGSLWNATQALNALLALGYFEMLPQSTSLVLRRPEGASKDAPARSAGRARRVRLQGRSSQ